MKKIMLIIGCIAGLSLMSVAQNCKMYIASKKGTKTELQHSDKSGKVTGFTASEIVDTYPDSVHIKSTTKDKKGKETSSHVYTMSCKNGAFVMDMRQYMKDLSSEGLQAEVTCTDLEFPASLSVGQKLNDAKINMRIASGFLDMDNFVEITNRKVEAQETITTNAGTFTCWKISYNMNMKMLVAVQSTGFEWYAPEVGMVKSEAYDTEGKLLSTSLLSLLVK